jgi:hypothetical protein
MINCAHPTHFADELNCDAAWVRRIRGVRANASRCSHAELNESTELDDGNPTEFGEQVQELRSKRPSPDNSWWLLRNGRSPCRRCLSFLRRPDVGLLIARGSAGWPSLRSAGKPAPGWRLVSGTPRATEVLKFRAHFPWKCGCELRTVTLVRIDILSLFPAIAASALAESILGRAQERGLIELRHHNLRDWATNKHKTTDDLPYGGGQGMVMKCEPMFAAVEELRTPNARVVLLSPGGRVFTQRVAEEFARLEHLILLCGHYEGVDQRVIEHLVDEELSIGDYVLTNGVIAAVVGSGCSGASAPRRAGR